MQRGDKNLRVGDKFTIDVDGKKTAVEIVTIRRHDIGGTAQYVPVLNPDGTPSIDDEGDPVTELKYDFTQTKSVYECEVKAAGKWVLAKDGNNRVFAGELFTAANRE